MRRILSYFVICFIVWIECSSIPIVKPSTQKSVNIFSSEQILEIMKRVADYQIANPSSHYSERIDFPMGWVPASFYTGVMELYKTSKDEKYLNQAIKWSESNNWQTGPRFGYADDIACGQTYLEIYMIKKDTSMISHLKAVLDSFMTISKSGREEWW